VFRIVQRFRCGEVGIPCCCCCWAARAAANNSGPGRGAADGELEADGRTRTAVGGGTPGGGGGGGSTGPGVAPGTGRSITMCSVATPEAWEPTGAVASASYMLVPGFERPRWAGRTCLWWLYERRRLSSPGIDVPRIAVAPPPSVPPPALHPEGVTPGGSSPFVDSACMWSDSVHIGSAAASTDAG